jgi:hypothetical protein
MMIATSVLENLSYADLKSGPAAEIIMRIEILHGLLLKVGITNRPYTASAVNILRTLPREKHLSILKSLQVLTTLIESSGDLTIGTEINEPLLVDKALEYFNFKMKNHSWETTAKNEIIEIYNHEGIQLYRSLNFFTTCGYSLLDLCVNEWYVLWERPRRVIDQLAEIVADLFAGKKAGDSTVYVPRHLIRETYDDGTTQPFQPRSILVEFKNIYPTYSADDRINGFIATSTAQVVSIGDEALQLDFI